METVVETIKNDLYQQVKDEVERCGMQLIAIPCGRVLSDQTELIVISKKQYSGFESGFEYVTHACFVRGERIELAWGHYGIETYEVALEDARKR